MRLSKITCSFRPARSRGRSKNVYNGNNNTLRSYNSGSNSHNGNNNRNGSNSGSNSYNGNNHRNGSNSYSNNNRNYQSHHKQRYQNSNNFDTNEFNNESHDFGQNTGNTNCTASLESQQETVRQKLRSAAFSRNSSSLQMAINEALSLGMHFEVNQGRKQLARIQGL